MGEQAEGKAEVKPTVVLGIFLNSGSETEKALRHVALHEALDGKTLADVRSLLFNGGQLTAEQARYPFCSKDGGSVPENTAFSVYSGMLSGTEEPRKESGEEEKAPEKAIENPKVILKKETIWTDLNEKTQKFLGEKLNLDYRENKAALLEAPLTKLSSSYDHKGFAATVGKATAVHPADMTEQNWDAVMRTNNVLSGQSIITGKFGPTEREITTIERGVYTAFKLKSRDFEPYQISYTTLETIGGKQSLKIPRFRVVDDSSVSVYETKTALASALAKSSFSETVVEASAGGGFMGMSAAVSVGYSEAEETADANSSSSSKEVMNISYNFPRVVLYLGVENLELSAECQESLQQVKTREDVMDFFKRFGSFFARRVELGGRLHSEQASSEFSSSSVSQRSQSMKAAASASFSSSFAQASVSASHEKQSNSSNSNQSSSLQNSITWEAQGGDTLLCNNPAAWCPTVASFYNWRVMKQDDVCSIVDMIGMMKGYSWVPRQFAEATKQKKRLQFRLNAKEKHGFKVQGCLALSMSGPRERVHVGYKTSNPTQRNQGHIINRILEFNPLARLQSASKDGEYFEVRDADFREIEGSRLEYQKLYRLYNPHSKLWLSVTDDLQPHTAQRFLYGGNIEDASLFHLETPGSKKLKGTIENGHRVQLCMSNEDKKEQGIVMLLDHHDWKDHIGIHAYSNEAYNYIIYTELEYGP